MKLFQTTSYKLIVLILVCVLVLCFFRYLKHSETIDQTFSESTKILDNPYQGLYHIVGYTLSDDFDQQSDITSIANHYKESLVLLEINLKNYKNQKISASGLAQLEKIFHAWSDSHAQIILRFLYDWDGIAKASEPDSIDTIMTHMDQVAKIINSYKNSIYLMQGVFIGNWGEMHGSSFSEPLSIKRLMNHLDEVIDPDIFLSVRTPSQWRSIINCYDIPKNMTHQRNSLASRLGLFNDGMLGSISDLGTYGNVLKKDATSPSYQGTREEEISFQKKLCQYVPNGGEVVAVNSYNDLDVAVKDLSDMHVSYLNADYDAAVFEKWRDSKWTKKDSFYNLDGVTYIKAHLGYRYWLERLQINSKFNGTKKITLTIKNTGFSNTLNPFDTKLVLVSKENEETKEFPIDFDFCTLLSGQKKSITKAFSNKNLKKGTWDIYLSVRDKQTDQEIHLANTPEHKKNGMKIGQLKL